MDSVIIKALHACIPKLIGPYRRCPNMYFSGYVGHVTII